MMKKILIFLSFFVLYIAFTAKTQAAVAIDFIDSGSPASAGYTGPVPDSFCSAERPKPAGICSNGSSKTTTTCAGEDPCNDGSLWTKYALSGCYQNTGVDNAYAWVYFKSDVICSIADKCGDASGNNVGPYLNAGFCDCTVGGTYKVCCSGSNLSSQSCVQQTLDTTNPPFEGVCPAGTTTKACGSDPAIYAALGQPFTNVPCGQAACVIATPTPTPTGCSGAPTFLPPPNSTTANTPCDPAATSCTIPCTKTCTDSSGKTCSVTGQSVWACQSGTQWYNDGTCYASCPVSCNAPPCQGNQTRTTCGGACTLPRP